MPAGCAHCVVLRILKAQHLSSQHANLSHRQSCAEVAARACGMLPQRSSQLSWAVRKPACWSDLHCMHAHAAALESASVAVWLCGVSAEQNLIAGPQRWPEHHAGPDVQLALNPAFSVPAGSLLTSLPHQQLLLACMIWTAAASSKSCNKHHSCNKVRFSDLIRADQPD